MNPIFRKIFFLMFLPMVFLGCNDLSEEVVYLSDYPHYQTVSEIEGNSDIIIRGKVIDSSVEVIDVSGSPLTDEELNDEQLNPHPDGERPEEELLELVYTVSEIEIDEIYKGTSNDKVIQIKQGGGELDDVLYIEHNVIMLENDQSYILFLKTFDSVPASLLNPYQAAYLYKDGDIQSLHPDNDLSLEKGRILELKDESTNKQ